MKTITYNPETHVLVPRTFSAERIVEQAKDKCTRYNHNSVAGACCFEFRLFDLIDFVAGVIAAAPQPVPVDSEPICEWVKAAGANYLRQKWHKDYVAVEGDKLYLTRPLDRTAELETALEECRNYPIITDNFLETLAKVNEVLK